MRDGIGVGALVVDGREGIGRYSVVQSTAESLPQLGPHPVAGARLANCLYNYVSSLSNSKGHDVSCEWLYRYEVLSNNSELMPIYAELLDALSASVDESQEVLLSRLELELGYSSIGCAWKCSVCARVVHPSVDQVVIAWWEATSHRAFNERKVVSVEPILHDNWTDVDVILLMLWPIDNKRTMGTTRILSAVMAVVPGRPVAISAEEHLKISTVGRDGTLCDCRYSIKTINTCLVFN